MQGCFFVVLEKFVYISKKLPNTIGSEVMNDLEQLSEEKRKTVETTEGYSDYPSYLFFDQIGIADNDLHHFLYDKEKVIDTWNTIRGEHNVCRETAFEV